MLVSCVDTLGRDRGGVPRKTFLVACCDLLLFLFLGALSSLLPGSRLAPAALSAWPEPARPPVYIGVLRLNDLSCKLLWCAMLCVTQATEVHRSDTGAMYVSKRQNKGDGTGFAHVSSNLTLSSLNLLTSCQRTEKFYLLLYSHCQMHIFFSL